MKKALLSVLILVPLFLLGGCKTKSEIRQEQEFERMKSELRSVKSDRAEVDTISEELKTEITRMSNLVEDRAQQQRQGLEELRREVNSLAGRVAALESSRQAEEVVEKRAAAERAKPTFDLGKRYYDEGRFEEAADVFKAVVRARPKGEEGKKAQFYLGESYFSAKDYATAAIEFSDFKKAFPRDNLVPQAIYRQANSFRNMNRSKEAKLFYQELIERFPKSPYTAKAKSELKKLK